MEIHCPGPCSQRQTLIGAQTGSKQRQETIMMRGCGLHMRACAEVVSMHRCGFAETSLRILVCSTLSALISLQRSARDGAAAPAL